MATDDLLSEAYRFELPPELIAQTHAHPRDASRLLVMCGDALHHTIFAELANGLRSGDLLVLNETKVIAARIFGERREGGGKVELLLLRPSTHERYDGHAARWLALVKPGRKMRPGQRIDFAGLGFAEVLSIQEDGIREVEFTLTVPFEEFLRCAGRLPLPPYIQNESEEAQTDYQTIFARVPGSVAAPTASLHFTPSVMQALADHGVHTARLTLDVGLGTFRPIKAQRLDEHVMHAETFEISKETVAAIAAAKEEGRRVVAAGTTVMRALEGSAQKHGAVREGADSTSIFITPGFQFRVVDALITNFHLPQSTLLVLVSAFAGRERIMRAYQEAIAQRYRFFSFGDAMLIEP